jgi:hypothetical protein
MKAIRDLGSPMFDAIADRIEAEAERLREQVADAKDGWESQTREVERLNHHIMFCPEGHGIYVEKRNDYVQCPTCEVERLRAAFSRYGDHDRACDARANALYACTCGFVDRVNELFPARGVTHE